MFDLSYPINISNKQLLDLLHSGHNASSFGGASASGVGAEKPSGKSWPTMRT